MALAKGAVLNLTIEKPAAGGRMIARAEGQVVLVSGAIPGERVTARLERVAKGVAYASVTAIEEASPDRRDAGADPLCGGCLYAHVGYPRQLEIKAQVIADAFARIARLSLPAAVRVAPSREDGYRMRARLHIRGGRAGFFREGTHELCDPRVTRQLLPESCDAIERTVALASDGTLDGRDLELSENVAGTERGMAVGTRIVSGEPYVRDTLLVDGHEMAWRRHVLAFFQGNRYLLGDLVTHVVSQIDKGARVVDLYAGGGLFTLPVAVARGARITAVEGDRMAAADLAWNAQQAGARSIEARHQPVEMFRIKAADRPDAVIVDPPRTGMSRDALSAVLALGAQRIVYVSCDVATLARDARLLADASFALSRLDAFDMFPNTPHVESVAIFDRV
jgi:23S rRNA (uracil1939-C5)-methyltransferase